MTTELIARVCHEANRAYCKALGDDSQSRWDDAPDWQRESVLNGVRLHLEGRLTPQESHENWLKRKVDEGWRFGEVKNPEAKIHPCMVPFEELPVEQQAKDYIFKAIVDTLA